MENSQKNLVKELAEQFINWMANDNNDTKNYAKMYGLVWSLLFIIGLWSSYNAAHADFSVLYGHYFNTTNNHSSSWWNALFIASFIQATILIPAGVILKILVNNLQKEAGEKGEKHIIQLCYLTPILLFGLVWSTRLSLNMDQAARAESYDNYKALLKQYDENTYKRDSVLLEINNQKTTSVNDNEKLLMEKFREDSLFQVQLYNSKKDSLTRRRNYLIKRHKETGSNWMIASANKIKSQKIPQLRNIRDVNIRQAKSQMTTTLLDSKLAIENSFKTEASTQDSIYSFTESKLEGFITTFEQDLKKNARKRKLMSIMFNLLSLVIVGGLQEVYKRINKGKSGTSIPPDQTNSSSAHSDWIPVSYIRGQNDETLATQETQSPHNSTQLIYADIDRLQNQIRNTYYPRCFLKSKIGERGSTHQATCEDNIERVKMKIEKLENYGVKTTIDFEHFREVSFEPEKV